MNQSVTHAVETAPGVRRFDESARMRAVQTPIIPTVGQWIRETAGTLSLAQGVVFYPPPPQAIAAASEFLTDGEHRYGPVQGQPALRSAIAAKLRRENGIDVGDGERRLLVTAGGNMAFLNAMFAICDSGDEVILPTPYYFNHEMAIRMVGAVPVLAPTDDDYQLDLNALRRAITARTRAIVTVSPNNPTGMVYRPDDLRAVNALCREAGIFHVSDEAYEHFTYGEARHHSPGSGVDAAAHTISIFSLSKSFGFASWRIGYMVVPPQLFAALMKAQDTNLICASLIAQQAAAAIVGGASDYREQQRSALARVRTTVIGELNALGERCTLSASQGAFYFLLRPSTTLSGLELTERLIREHRVAVLPGSAFGIGSGCTLRMSYGGLAPGDAVAGIKRLVGGLDAILD
jgi:aspartate/methionine/tyrosine aminotransferase